MRLNNGFEIPQIGVGTWTLRGETARQNVRLALRQGKVRSIGVSNIDVIGHPLLQSLAAKYQKTA